MAKRSRKKKPIQGGALGPASGPKDFQPKSIPGAALSGLWLPLFLAAVAFLAYRPSLKSDLVYDARMEMEEGFITSLSNLPAVLSLKVLGMNLILASRPGELLYLMLIAAVCGQEPFGYHLCGNFLHAANVALLFVLLRRLIATELTGMAPSIILKAQLVAVAVTLIFALHPVVVEPVAEVSYSSDLLVTFFTLLALLVATTFRPENFRGAILSGIAGVLCSFAAVTCKESGLAAALLLIVYWFLFRRSEEKKPWLLFLGAATSVTAAFLAARFLFAFPSQQHLHYLGGSFPQVFLVQPRLWVFMMGKLLWPAPLSADYTLENVSGLSTSVALAILAVVVSLQTWLAWRSRMGALGVAIYWLGLVTVSNFTPLNRIVADRFYYLPLAGVTLQLLALLLMILRSRWGFRVALAFLIVALLPFTVLTLARETVFAGDFSLWSDTLQVSPFSATAHNNLGADLEQSGRMPEAVAHYEQALRFNPAYPEAHYNFGNALLRAGRTTEAIGHYRQALNLKPDFVQAHSDLGIALAQSGHLPEAIEQCEEAIRLRPDYAEAHNNLGVALDQLGRVAEAIEQFKEALKFKPDYPDARNNLEALQKASPPKN